jgi:hypothetical protein
MRSWRGYLLSEDVKVYIHGYVKPEESFHTLEEWKGLANKVLDFQKSGHYVSGMKEEEIHPELLQTVYDFYQYQLDIEVNRYELLTRKNVLDHIEDFVNHRFWALENEFGDYFPEFSSLRFAYFYSRGDLEPYVLVDDEFTTQIYGSTDNPKVLMHYTNAEGIERIQKAINDNEPFDISTYTVAERDFFRKESNKVVKLEGNVRAGFRSDVKSFSVSNGRKAVSMHRLGYPGDDQDNLCTDLENDCNGELRTSLWNEFIVTPIKILGVLDR